MHLEGVLCLYEMTSRERGLFHNKLAHSLAACPYLHTYKV